MVGPRLLGGVKPEPRHTAAPLWLAKNVNPQIVNECFGHSSVMLTVDTNSHVLRRKITGGL
jgi:hypothetical protein